MCILKHEVLSMIIAPDSTALGIKILDTSDPAEENTMSMSLKSNFSKSLMTISLSFRKYFFDHLI